MEFEAKLSQLADVIMGQSPPGEHVRETVRGLPLLNGPTEFGPSHPRPVQWTDDVRKRCNAGDILFCVRGSTTGRMNWADQPYAIGRGIAAIRPLHGFDATFVRAVLEAGLSDLLALATGSTFPNLSRSDLLSVPAPKVSSAESVKVGSLLAALDNRIDHNRALAANLEAIARALFKSWFVDFDPVRAKAAGEAPPGLAPDLASLFPDRFVDSELGEIPEGWSVKALDEAFELNPRRSLSKGADAPYLDMASTPTKGHVPDQVVSRQFSSGTKFINGDTLLARITPCLENGKAAFVDFLGDKEVGWGSTEFIVLRPKAPLPPYFGYLLARYTPFKAHAISSMSGTSGRQRVQPDSLATWELAVPDEAVAKAFGTILEPLRAAIACANEESRVLAKMRDLLLPRLISGKLRVEDAEAALEAA